ncbi:hypothetical protein PG984_004671 [Apiospora sp. TS-2023a]
MEVDDNQAEGPNLPEGNGHQEVDFKSKTVSNYLKSIDTEFARLETEYEQLLQDIEKTRRELSTSDRRLIGTQRHIFSLQDHRVHLVADTAGSTDPRLRKVAYLPESEDDVVHACIFHWITRQIFQDGLRHVDDEVVDIIESQEQALIGNKVPLYAARTWRAQAYYAWTKTTNYQAKREQSVSILATELETDMAMFIQQWNEPEVVQLLRKDIKEPKYNPSPVVESLRNDIREIIELAFALKEEMMSSREDFKVAFDHYSPLSEDQEVDQSPIDFKWSECLDLTKNRRIVSPSNLGRDKANRLRALFAITPGLMMRKIKDDNTFGQPKVIRKQCLLVESPKPVEKPRTAPGGSGRALKQSTQVKETEPTFFSTFCEEHNKTE